MVTGLVLLKIIVKENLKKIQDLIQIYLIIEKQNIMAVNLLSKPKHQPADIIFDYYTIEDYDANKPFAEQDFAEFRMHLQTEETDINL